MNDTKTLLPCPFCGDPMLDDHGTLRHVHPGDCPIGEYDWGSDRDIAAWNRRASHEARIAELEGALRPFAEADGEAELRCEYCGDTGPGNRCRVSGGHSFKATGDRTYTFEQGEIDRARHALHTEGE